MIFNQTLDRIILNKKLIYNIAKLYIYYNVMFIYFWNRLQKFNLFYGLNL